MNNKTLLLELKEHRQWLEEWLAKDDLGMDDLRLAGRLMDYVDFAVKKVLERLE